jgi:uncharacterized protein
VTGELTVLDLAGLRLAPGEGRRLALSVQVDPIELGGERYEVQPPALPASLEVSRMVGHGYALRLDLQATLHGPCMRCLLDARPTVAVDAREVDRPGGGEELSSPYVTEELLDVAAWARDALLLVMPAKVLCREDCAGLCPVCAANLNEVGPEHVHAPEPDARWAKLRELKLE